MNSELSTSSLKNIMVYDASDPYDISVVVPVYNSAETLVELNCRIKSVMSALQKSYQILFVEDCGSDSSWNIIEKLTKTDEHVFGVKLARNSGQHNALFAGISRATGRIIVTIDDDLQNPPEEIPRLIEGLTGDVDVVYGTPTKGQHGFLRNLASRITKFALQEAMGTTNARNVSTFRVFRRSLVPTFAHYKGSMANIDVFLTWGTSRFSSVSVKHEPRTVGASGYTFKKLILHAFNMLTGFTIVPLQIASILGFVFSMLGLMVLLYVIVAFVIYPNSVAGFTFIASMIAILSGVQLFSIGILGEYLARVHISMMQKPAFSVREEVSHFDNNDTK